jgi:hypothetical protein
VVIMALAIMPPARFALILAAVITVVGEPLLLIKVGLADGLTRRLLWVGLVGRLASLWTFCCTVSLAVSRWSVQTVGGGPWWQQEVVTALGVLVFAVSAYAYLEELRRER